MMREALAKIHSVLLRTCSAGLLLTVAACVSRPDASPAPVKFPPVPVATPQLKGPASVAAAPTQQPNTKSAPAASNTGVVFRPAAWIDLPGWRDDQLNEAWSAFLSSCGSLVNRDPWREVCSRASRLTHPSTEVVRRFFEGAFRPWQVTGGERSDEGLMTGYYEPLLRGSRKPTGTFSWQRGCSRRSCA